ncbi:hypothetical protein ISS96_02470 [Candidatus Bathyarchaeota archaeon]|nr:hypothetical protein [Candidatus Bathyarchaeota archaeon]
MDCPICSKIKQNGWELCPDHIHALERIIDAFEVWNKAYGGISKEEYLKRIPDRPETGKLVTEVAQFLLLDEENMALWKEEILGD